MDGCGDDRGEVMGVPSSDDGDASRCAVCDLLVCTAVTVFRFLVEAVVKLCSLPGASAAPRQTRRPKNGR